MHLVPLQSSSILEGKNIYPQLVYYGEKYFQLKLVNIQKKIMRNF